MAIRNFKIPGFQQKENTDELQLFSLAERKILEKIVPGLYPSWKTGQLKAIYDIYKSKEKIVGVRAPTGFGKSAVAMAVCLLTNGRAINLTQTIQLGEQYLRDFKPLSIETVKGRNNFMCTIAPMKTASEAACVGGMRCSYKSGGCDYYDQKNVAIKADLVSMNLQYFLYEANYAGNFSGPDILFIDEAHKLDSALRSFIEVRLSKRRLREFGCEVPNNASIESIQEWKKEIYPDLSSELSDINEQLLSDTKNEILIVRSQILSTIVNALRKLEIVNDSWIKTEDTLSYTLKPVWIGEYTQKFLWIHSKKIVLMSGTLPTSILDKLGLVNYEYLKISSTFPVENRPIYAMPVANLAKSAKEPLLEQKKLIVAVKAIIKKHTGQKGIIHTSNYSICKLITDALKSEFTVFTHEDASTRTDCLEKFTTSKTGVLVSPSFTEGVDLPYDNCRFQIIAKLPYANLGDEQVKRRNNSDPKWYGTDVIITLVQAYGRIMRSEDDSGVTYILDSGLLKLIERWRTVFDEMEWFLEALFLVKSDNTVVPFYDVFPNPDGIEDEEKGE